MTAELLLRIYKTKSQIANISRESRFLSYTASINCCIRTLYCNNNKSTEFEMIDTKKPSTAYVVMCELIT